jgi:hypothetical protein
MERPAGSLGPAAKGRGMNKLGGRKYFSEKMSRKVAKTTLVSKGRAAFGSSLLAFGFEVSGPPIHDYWWLSGSVIRPQKIKLEKHVPESRSRCIYK